MLNECFRFLLDVPSIKGTVVEKRISDISSQGFASKSVYKLKTNKQDLVRNFHMYTDTHIEELKTILADYNLFFGYARVEDHQSNTAFFNYSEGSLSEE